MSSHSFDPPPQIGALLRFAWEDVQEEIFEGLRAAGFDDFRRVHQPLMRYPGLDGRRPGELAASIGHSKQHVNDTLRSLEQLGYVYLEPDPEDGRGRVIRLTKRGVAWYDTASAVSAAVGRRWAAQIGEEKYAAFEDTLCEIAALTRRGRLVDPTNASAWRGDLSHEG